MDDIAQPIADIIHTHAAHCTRNEGTRLKKENGDNHEYHITFNNIKSDHFNPRSVISTPSALAIQRILLHLWPLLVSLTIPKTESAKAEDRETKRHTWSKPSPDYPYSFHQCIPPYLWAERSCMSRCFRGCRGIRSGPIWGGWWVRCRLCLYYR